MQCINCASSGYCFFEDAAFGDTFKKHPQNLLLPNTKKRVIITKVLNFVIREIINMFQKLEDVEKKYEELEIII